MTLLEATVSIIYVDVVVAVAVDDDVVVVLALLIVAESFTCQILL